MRLCTYNVLADKYAGFMQFCPPKYLKWEYRGPRLLDELVQLSADVYFLQEVEEQVYEDEWLPEFKKRGYDGAVFMRDTGYVPGPREGCVLLWNSAALACEHRASFAFRTCLPAAQPHERCEATEHARSLQDGAVMALLRHRATARPLLAACAHLYWDPRWPDVKLLQASALCGQVAAFLRGHGLDAATTPIAVGGDFNSLWRKHRSDEFDTLPAGVPHITSGVYELLSTGRVDGSHHDHPLRRRPGHGRGGGLDTAGLRLRSAQLACRGREPPLTTKTATFCGAIDYIWLSATGGPRATAAGPMPYEGGGDGDVEAAADAFAPCPNEHRPSDHLPVYCDVETA